MTLLFWISSIHYHKIANGNYTLFMDMHCVCVLYIICKQNSVSIIYRWSCTILSLLQEMSLWVWNAKLGLITLCMIGVIKLDLFTFSSWLISQVSYYWTLLQHPLNCNNAARCMKSKNPVILSVIDRRQSPLESNNGSSLTYELYYKWKKLKMICW
jgi:hypothetical protein